MKKQKSIAIIFALLIFFAAVFQVSSDTVNVEFYNYGDLMKIAEKEGFVRIIAQIDVPGIYELTEESTRYKTGCSETAYVQAAFEADSKLNQAISKVTDQVFYQLKDTGYRVTNTFSTIPYVALAVSPGALGKMINLPEVVNIREDRLLPLPEIAVQSVKDENISLPQLLDSAELVGAEDAWSMGYTGSGWYVAILDSGILPNHECFNRKNIVEQCYSALGDCPNGNTSMSGPGSAAHVMSGESHGTHVAGIAACDSGKNVFGIAKGADIIAVQVFSYIAAWNDIGSYDSDQVKGLEFVYSKRNQYKIAAVNMSLGGGEYSSYCDGIYGAEKNAIDNLKAARIATAIASGNAGYCGATDAPGCISSAVTVSGTTKTDNHWTWGNWHKNIVDLMAPAASIYSAISDGPNSYAAYSGTSMSTPHVTGAYAVLRQADPNLTFNKALSILQDEGKMVASQCSATPRKARIDIGAAVKSLVSLVPPLNFAGEQKVNRSLLQTEYINVLTWAENPLNEQNNQNIVKYRVYTVDSSDNLTLLIEVNADIFEYRHRGITAGTDYEYAIKSVNAQGNESSASQIIAQAL